jgi:hypothetical protein
MIDTAELFAQMTCQIEDLHGIAVEGQEAGLPKEVSRAFAALVATGLQRAGAIVDQIERSLGDVQ